VPGVAELLIVLAIVLVIFGASRLPRLARSLGESKREFHSALAEDQSVAGPCPFCATTVPPEAKFCPGCGKSAESIVARKKEAASPL
jgi:sec-independent protein translocase protein TatA